MCGVNSTRHSSPPNPIGYRQRRLTESVEPCNVCGTLNSSEADTCLSCGYPTSGRKRSAVYQWVAIVLVLALVSVVIAGIVDAIQSSPNTPPNPLETTPTLGA